MTPSKRQSILLAAVTLVTIDAYVSTIPHHRNANSAISSMARFDASNPVPTSMKLQMQALSNSRRSFSSDRGRGLLTVGRPTSTCRITDSGTTLHMAADPNNDDKDKNPEDKESSELNILGKVTALWRLVVMKIMKFFPTLRTAVASFVVGAIFALSVIFIPVYESVDKMSEPVTLFETILAVSS